MGMVSEYDVNFTNNAECRADPPRPPLMRSRQDNLDTVEHRYNESNKTSLQIRYNEEFFTVNLPN